ELVDPEEYKLPEGASTKWKITPREVEMAEQLIESMSGKWDPAEFKDDFRERLQDVIEKRVRAKQVVQPEADEDERPPEGAATNVIDFAELLKRSLAKKGGKGATRTANTTASKTATKSTAKTAKKTAKKTKAKSGA